MRNLINAVKGLVKLSTVSIDNAFFQLHYQFTVIILIAFSLLVASRQYFGKPMDCHFPDYTYGSLNDYCSVQPTYLDVTSGTYYVDNPISHHEAPNTSKQKGEIKYYGYYQWVSIALFIQAVFFSIPQYIWKTCERDRMKTLTHDLTSPCLSKECITEKVEHLMDYFFMQLHGQNSYAYKYFSCELLNFINVVGQICFMNAFIGNDFVLYGIYVIFFDQTAHPNTTNPMKQVFPTITKCTFYEYGPSGTRENYEGLCILTGNVVNERIYVFLWFWIYVLAIISGIVVLYRIALLASPTLRLSKFRTWSLMDLPHDVQLVHEQLQIGNWFLLHGPCKNMNPMIYKQLVSRIARRIQFDV